MGVDRLTPDVLILGAGFAGLSAATALAERGARVLVLEARPTLGGRATAFTDPETGERVDNGQHVLFGCYHETFRFLRRIGADGDVRLEPRLAVGMVDRSGRASRLECPSLPSPWHLLVGVLRWGAIGWRDRLAVLRMGRAIAAARAGPANGLRQGYGGPPKLDAKAEAGHYADQGPAKAGHYVQRDAPHSSGRAWRDQETVRQWLVRHGQTPRLIDLLWEPLAVAAMNQPIDVAAASPFLGVLAGLFGRDPRDSALAIPRKPLDELYAVPSRAFIERHGGEVRTGAVARILCGAAVSGNRAAESGRASGTNVGSGFSRTEPGSNVASGLSRTRELPARAPLVAVGNETIEARAVICAVPWHALPSCITDPAPMLARVVNDASGTAASPIVTVNLWFDRVVTRDTFVGLPGRTWQWVFDKAGVFGGSTSHLSLVSSGAEAVVACTNQQLIDLALAEVRQALPEAFAAILRRAVVVREKRATFSLAPNQPPRPGTRTDVPGLFLAGDWIETGLPATIESAVVSGHWAAAAVESD